MSSLTAPCGSTESCPRTWGGEVLQDHSNWPPLGIFDWRLNPGRQLRMSAIETASATWRRAGLRAAGSVELARAVRRSSSASRPQASLTSAIPCFRIGEARDASGLDDSTVAGDDLVAAHGGVGVVCVIEDIGLLGRAGTHRRRFGGKSERHDGHGADQHKEAMLYYGPGRLPHSSAPFVTGLIGKEGCPHPGNYHNSSFDELSI